MPAKSPGNSPLKRAWTPRLLPFEDDRAVFEKAPFGKVFQNYFHRPLQTRDRTPGSSDGSVLFTLVSPQLDTDYWVSK